MGSLVFRHHLASHVFRIVLKRFFSSFPGVFSSLLPVCRDSVRVHIIKPRLYGDQLGVSGVLILIAIIVGGRIFGMVGILLGIPVAAIAMFVYDEYVIPKLEQRKGHQASEEKPPESPEPPESL